MLKRAWIEELSDEAKSAWVILRAFWSEDVLPLLMMAWMFFVVAVPLIIVILILWYLDSIGWRSSDGFYTIGAASGTPALSLLSGH